MSANIGDRVAVHYIGKLNDGTVFDKTEKQSPFYLKIGSKQVLPSFEKQLIGMKVGEEKTFTILSKDGYGPLQEQLIIEVPLEKLPSHIKPKIGQRLNIPLKKNGLPYPVTIMHTSDISITIDANHPLAEKDLHFYVKMLSIEKNT